MTIKALLSVCVLCVGHTLGVLAPVGYGNYGPYGGYGAPWGAAWNPYSAYPTQPVLTSQSQNIFRSPFNFGQISTYSKAIDTPFSSVRKADIRVSNPGLAVAPVGISPYVSHVGVTPVAPVAKVTSSEGLLGVAYSAAPAVSHMTYTNGLGYSYSW